MAGVLVPFFLLFFQIFQTSKCVEIPKPPSEGLSSVYQPPSLLKPRSVATAKFLSGKQGEEKSFKITNEAEYWFDVNKITEDKKLDAIDKLCVQGVWLLYDNLEFQAASMKEVGVISSSESACVSLKEYGKIKSMQPITLMGSRKVDTLSFFPDRNFSGMVWPVDQDDENGNGPTTSSLITLGKQEWTIIPTSGDPVCISPQGKNFEFPVCFVSKLVDGDKITSGNFLKINKGCDEKIAKKKVEIHFCVDYESGKIKRIDDLGEKAKGRSLGRSLGGRTLNVQTNTKTASSDECPKENSDEDQLDKEGKDLIQIRLTKDLQSNVNYLWPKDPKNIWKLELLERVINVVFATCPDPLVPEPYLMLIREYFVYLWETHSKKSGKQTFSDDDWRILNLQLQECNANVREAPLQIPELAMAEYTSADTPDKVNASIDPMLQYREKYDPVIETVWLVANHVAAVCHHSLGFETNFWPNFIDVFQEMYLNNLETQWTKPGKLLNAYKYIFGGYGIQNTYNKMAICATVAITMIDNLDPFDRSVDMKNKI